MYFVNQITVKKICDSEKSTDTVVNCVSKLFVVYIKITKNRDDDIDIYDVLFVCRANQKYL